MTIITDEMRDEALADIEAAPVILFWAEVAMVGHGITDGERVVPALLTAAWYHHKESYGEQGKAAFSALLRRLADRVDAMERPH